MPGLIRRMGVVLVTTLLTAGWMGATPEAGVAQTPSPATGLTGLQRAGRGIAALQAWYDPATGLYKTTGWWNSANALTVLIDYARVTKSAEYNYVIANTFVAAQNKFPGFLNQYYDDEGWWALAWVDAYDLSGNHAYLAMAESIFADMQGAWDDTCSGGIWWSKERHYKNAIANELFLSVAAHLANRDAARRSEYLEWANREWRWFAATGMINPQNLINDGLGSHHGGTTAAACANNGATTWTYNQGVVLGSLAELSKLSTDPSLPQAAQKVATAAITHLVDRDGLLHDPCEPNCGADGTQFKGIFVRNLVSLYHAFPQQDWQTFIDKNANAIWDHDRNDADQFGTVWSGPFNGSNASSQSSALDAMVAAAVLESRDR